jgi:hypothetical protein
MNFAAPWALAWAALAIPIIGFYILKIRLRQAPVSTTIFWRQIYDEKKPRSLWQNLRHLLSLLMQLLLLVLLVFALGAPFWNWEILQARRIIIILDNSASMRASDVSPTRLDAAKNRALALVSTLRFRDEMAILSAGAQPEVVCGLTSRERTLHDAISLVKATDGPTRVKETVSVAKRLLADVKHGSVVVLSDACFEGATELADDQQIDLEVIGTRIGNVGIANLQVRRSLLDPVGYEILLEVVNQSDDEVKCRLDVDLNDQPVDVFPLTLKPGEIWRQAIEKTSVDGGTLVAKLDRADAFALDNQAIALLPKRELQKVAIVGSKNLFLRTALKVNSLVDLSLLEAPPQKYDPKTIYVFHQSVPEKLPATGRFLIIDPDKSTDRWTMGEKLENPIVAKQDPDSPLLRHVRLDNVLLPEAKKLTPIEGFKPLVTALSGDPLIFAFDNVGVKMLVLTVNLDQGDLTFRTAFPILVTNSLGWFAGQSGELRESLPAGAVTSIDLPSRTAKSPALAVISPLGDKRTLPPEITRVSLGPLDACGVWRVDTQTQNTPQTNATPAPPIAEVACNLASPEESDLRVPKDLLGKSETALTAAGFFNRPIWLYLLVFAWGLFTVEWFLYQRRWIT